jgi:hypothetical protein
MLIALRCCAKILGYVICAALPSLGHAYFIVPQAGSISFELLEGHGATSLQEIGFGTPSESSTLAQRDVLYQVHLVNENVESVNPSSIVNAGFFSSGVNLEFYQRSDFGGIHWAFSSRLGGMPTFSDLEVFTDRNGSLGLGGSAIQQISPTSWVFHFDDAASVDDDDNELVFKLTLTPVPEPTTFSFFVICGAVLCTRKIISVSLRRTLWKLCKSFSPDAMNST